MLIAGNIVCLIGSVIMMLIGLIKTKKNIVLAQCGMFSVFVVGNLMLGGITGAVSNFLSILRNIFSLKYDLNLPVKLGFIAVQAGITYFTNNLGIIGWFPLAACALLTLFIDTKNAYVLKAVIIAGQLFWAVYDFAIKNYAGVAFDIITVLTNIVGMLRIKKNENTAGCHSH